MSDNAIAQLEQELKIRGLSMTKARKSVLDTLQNQEPQTMHTIVELCKDVNRASVYRTIALFERLGIVQRLQVGWKYQLELTDAFHEHHHHLRCAACGILVTLPEDSQLEKSLNSLAESYGFKLQSHQIELSGLCRNCRNREHK